MEEIGFAPVQTCQKKNVIEIERSVLPQSQGSPKANLSRQLRVLASFNLVQQELKTQTYAVGFLIPAATSKTRDLV